MGTGEVTDAVIVIAHRVTLEDKEARGAIERAHGERVGQLVTRLGGVVAAA